MLFDCSCEATAKLVAEAIDGDFALRPKANTPLAELVKTTTVVPITDLTAKLGEELKVVPLEDMAAQANNSLHNGWTNETVERAAAIVNRRVEIIRTTVLPTVRDISGAVLEAVKNVPVGAELPNIERYAACDMINVPGFMEKVERNTPISYISPDKAPSEEPKSREQLIEFLKMGSSTLDTALAVAINHVGADNLWLLWESLFVNGSKATVERYITFDQAVMDRSLGLDNAILIYVMTDMLKDSEFGVAKQYREGAAYWITKHAKTYNAEITGKKLLRTRMNERGAVVVNAVVYAEFLQRQGTAEMVLGAAASDNTYNTIDAILENSKDCLRAHTLLKSSSFTENSLKLSAAFRTSLTENFMRSFRNERSDAEQGYFEKYPGDESLVISKFDNLLAMVGASSLEDIYRNVAKVLCMSRFFYMDCESYLDAIDVGCKAGLSPEEAEVQAGLREISAFVTSMITK